MEFRSTTRRGWGGIALAVIAIVLLMHLSGLGSIATSSGICHTSDGQPGCIVSDALQETFAASTMVLFVAVLAALRFMRVGDVITAVAVFALARTRVQPLALASPMQRVLWKRTFQRTDDDVPSRYRMENLLYHLPVHD